MLNTDVAVIPFAVFSFSLNIYVFQIQGFAYGIMSILALLAYSCEMPMNQSKVSYLMYIIFFRGKSFKNKNSIIHFSKLAIAVTKCTRGCGVELTRNNNQKMSMWTELFLVGYRFTPAPAHSVVSSNCFVSLIYSLSHLPTIFNKLVFIFNFRRYSIVNLSFLMAIMRWITCQTSNWNERIELIRNCCCFRCQTI